MIFNETWYPSAPTGVNTVPFMEKMLDIISIYSLSSFFDSAEIMKSIQEDGFHSFTSGKSLLEFSVQRKPPQQLIINFKSLEFDCKYTFELSAEFTNGIHTLYVDEVDGESATQALKKLVETTIDDSMEYGKKHGTRKAKIVDDQLVFQEVQPNANIQPLSLHNEKDGYGYSLEVRQDHLTIASWTIGASYPHDGGGRNYTLEEFINEKKGHDWILMAFDEGTLDKAIYVASRYLEEKNQPKS